MLEAMAVSSWGNSKFETITLFTSSRSWLVVAVLLACVPEAAMPGSAVPAAAAAVAEPAVGAAAAPAAQAVRNVTHREFVNLDDLETVEPTTVRWVDDLHA